MTAPYASRWREQSELFPRDGPLTGVSRKCASVMATAKRGAVVRHSDKRPNGIDDTHQLFVDVLMVILSRLQWVNTANKASQCNNSNKDLQNNLCRSGAGAVQMLGMAPFRPTSSAALGSILSTVSPP